MGLVRPVCTNCCELSRSQICLSQTVQFLALTKMLQRLAVTNPKNDKMDPHGVNPTLSIFLPTPFPVAMQGLGATAP